MAASISFDYVLGVRPTLKRLTKTSEVWCLHLTIEERENSLVTLTCIDRRLDDLLRGFGWERSSFDEKGRLRTPTVEATQ